MRLQTCSLQAIVFAPVINILFPGKLSKQVARRPLGLFSLIPSQASHTCAQQRSALETLAGSIPVDRLEKWDVWAPAILTLDMGWKAEQQGRKAVL